MSSFGIFVIVGYLVVAVVVAKMHYSARHGISYGMHTPIFNTSSFVGLVWPVSMFVKSWRNPIRCSHPHHR
jgi:hypothetical protein